MRPRTVSEGAPIIMAWVWYRDLSWDPLELSGSGQHRSYFASSRDRCRLREPNWNRAFASDPSSGASSN